MPKARLLMLLLVLALTALCTFTAVPVAQADLIPSTYCWEHFSDQDCVYYYYNTTTGCCEGIRNHPGSYTCLDICLVE